MLGCGRDTIECFLVIKKGTGAGLSVRFLFGLEVACVCCSGDFSFEGVLPYAVLVYVDSVDVCAVCCF